MKKLIYLLVTIILYGLWGCSHLSYTVLSSGTIKEGEEDPEPLYDITLDENFQNYVEYLFIGNRSESFGTYFNKYYSAKEDFEEGLQDYLNTFIANYNPSIDSLDVVPPVSATAKEKFNSVIEGCSKIIQYHKSTRYLDDAVLLIGKSYYYMQEYLQAERKFSEFLSKLTQSELYDEAILYLGKTKMKMRQRTEGETILKNLFTLTDKNEIKAEIAEELAINSLSKKEILSGIDYFNEAIKYTEDKENKARRQFILAKIYLLTTPEKAITEYEEVIKNTSNFELEFYARLNKCKALITTNKYEEANEYANSMVKKYKDYTELLQQAEFVYALTFYYLKKYDIALTKFYDIIIDYPGGNVTGDSYFYIAKYYEEVKKDYLNALVNYNKATLNATKENMVISRKKANSLDKYFTLLAEINDTTKIQIPTENPEFEKYKKEKLKELEDKQDRNIPKYEGKGGGAKYIYNFYSLLDTNDEDVILKTSKDTVKEVIEDTLILNEVDSLLIKQKIEDSIIYAKNEKKFTACLNMAELFLFELNIEDSAIVYLDYVIESDTNSIRRSKSLYMIATIFRTKNQIEKSDYYLNMIIKDYPNTEIANEARRILNIETVEISKDPADSLYLIASSYFSESEYKIAIEKLREIYSNYPESPLAPKSLYTIGWLFENYGQNKDSMLYYYSLLVEKYPISIYSTAVKPKLQFFTDLTQKQISDSIKAIKDSLILEGDTSKIILQKDTVKILEKEKTVLPDENKGEEEIQYDSLGNEIKKDIEILSSIINVKNISGIDYRKPSSSFASSVIREKSQGGSNVTTTLASFIIGFSFNFCCTSTGKVPATGQAGEVKVITTSTSPFVASLISYIKPRSYIFTGISGS